MISAGRRLEERVLQIIQPYVHQDIPHFHFVNHFVDRTPPKGPKAYIIYAFKITI